MHYINLLTVSKVAVVIPNKYNEPFFHDITLCHVLSTKVRWTLGKHRVWDHVTSPNQYRPPT